MKLHVPASLLEVSTARALLRWRWVILLAGPPLAIGAELLEGHTWADGHLLAESVIYGLGIPVSAWFLLTLLGHNILQRSRIEQEHHRRRTFSRQLAQIQDWDELVRFLIQFPGTLLPVEHVALFLYDLQGLQLKPVAYGRAHTGVLLRNDNGPLHSRLCYTCQLPRLRHLTPCEFSPAGRGGQPPGSIVCVPLAYNQLLVGMLRLGCQGASSLTPEQHEFLDWAAPEIALALVRLVAYPGQITQARATAQAYERRQIAQTLHNSLAQQIGYLHLSLDRIASDSQAELPGPLRSELADLRDVADQAYTLIRNTLTLLRSQEDAIGPDVIAEHVRAAAQKANLSIDYVSQGAPPPLSPQLGHCLLSLVQECLNNVERHAQARSVQVTLSWAPNEVLLDIRDDGIGFETTRPAPPAHYGLAILQERVQELRGHMTLESAPGQGTRLSFRLPLTPATDERGAVTDLTPIPAPTASTQPSPEPGGLISSLT